MCSLQKRRAVLTALTSSPAPAQATWRRLVIPAVAAVVVTADQLTKTWALDHLRNNPRHIVGPVNLVLDFNPGAAFNLGTGVTPIVETVVVILVVALILWSRRASRQVGLLGAVGLGLLTGGALGNLCDRVFRHHHGAVVDFIQAVGWWPVFNVADASIVAGVIGLGLSSWSESSRGASAAHVGEDD